MLSCGRVKTELFENADVTVLIYGALGITKGHVACLFHLSSNAISLSIMEFCYGISNCECQTAFSCGQGYFQKQCLCGREAI